MTIRSLPVLLFASSLLLPLSASAAKTALSDDFSSYAKDVCTPDGGGFGPWTNAFSGFGCVKVERDAGQSWLHENPATSSSPGETHASLALGPAYSNPMTYSVRLMTVQQLRQGSAPNPWEVGWVVWHYADNTHFYYFYPKADGWELGKEDPAYPGAQRFLATGGSPTFPIGRWYAVKVVTEKSGRMSVYVDDRLITSFTDNERPYASGRIGLYNEDAHVQFTGITVQTPKPPAIASVAGAVSGPDSAVITWTTDDPSDSRVEYGPTAGYGSQTPAAPAMVTSHRVQLTGLSPGTGYHYRVRSKDADGDETVSGDYFLTTLVATTPPAPPPTTPPSPAPARPGGPVVPARPAAAHAQPIAPAAPPSAPAPARPIKKS